jgi:thioesterase domain-containing protein
VKFVRAAISTDFPQDPAAAWSKFLSSIEIETVPGDHLEIMTTHFELLASVLSRYVREALGGDRYSLAQSFSLR